MQRMPYESFVANAAHAAGVLLPCRRKPASHRISMRLMLWPPQLCQPAVTAAAALCHVLTTGAYLL